MFERIDCPPHAVSASSGIVRRTLAIMVILILVWLSASSCGSRRADEGGAGLVAPSSAEGVGQQGQTYNPEATSTRTPTPSATRSPTPTPTPFSCDQPPMVVLNAAASGAQASMVETPEPGQIYQTIGFLELPFPYDGGNENFGGTDEQFRRASQRSWAGGRINSFFDHLLPLYPAESRGREPSEIPIGKHVLIYDGTLWTENRTWYSGHPGYDFSTFVRGEATTPVFAAANGVVYAVGKHEASGALYVKIKHSIEGVGDFLTIYWHLSPHKYFEAMRGQVGKPIVAGTRIGTMGNTGWSTGHHLHFEVRFDGNKDGLFTLDEAVDPYGFIPSPDYRVDPWAQNWVIADGQGSDYGHNARPSPYLWIHPLGSSAQASQDGGGQLDLSGYLDEARQKASLCAPEGSLPPGSTIHWYSSSDPARTPGKVGLNSSFTLSIFDRLGRPVLHFDPPLFFQIPFGLADLDNFDPTTLNLYWLGFGGQNWEPLSSQIDPQHGVAIASIDGPGTVALLGLPLRDIVPPTTLIKVTGPTSEEGVWYQGVTVELSSTDQSGIELIEYSLDSGTTWQVYQEPFILESEGKLDPLPEEPVHDLGSGPGRYLVLASSTDGAGNVEDPPAFRAITIDPCQGPPPMVIAKKNVYCRSGPAIGFDSMTYVPQGQATTMIGRDAYGWWWFVELADGGAQCWLPWDLTEVEGEAACVEMVLLPPPAPGNFQIANRTCSANEHKMVLKWEDNSDMEVGFQVYRNGTLVDTLAPNSIKYTDNASFGGPFSYQIEAFNDAGSSPQRRVTEGEACVVSPPNPPKNLTLSSTCAPPGTHTNVLKWKDNANSEQGYRVYRNGALIAVLPANSTSYKDQNAPFSQALTYEVEAYNIAGSSVRRSVTEAPICWKII